MITGQCINCTNLFEHSEHLACIAFPGGIPEDILTGQFDHRNEHEGDHGFRYKPVGENDDAVKSWNPQPIKKAETRTQITIVARDEAGSLVDLLEYIKKTGNIGHSFEIVVDPDMSMYRKTFYWDGDGSDHIDSIFAETMDAER